MLTSFFIDKRYFGDFSFTPFVHPYHPYGLAKC